ncbi:MAG: SAM-dependent methyltransferase, partial [Burkholderiales bacterium]|nr:SAM-dependent methyltransferase [Burkholderiales bacterium]
MTRDNRAVNLTAADPIADFCEALRQSLADGSLVRGVLSKYRGPEADWKRTELRPVVLRGATHLQLVHHHATRDITKNIAAEDGAMQVRDLLGAQSFRAGHLHLADQTLELTITQKGQAHLRRVASQTAATPAPDHNREKQRWLTLDRPFLAELGVTTRDGQLVPAMSRKWKQINKFVEVFAGALAGSRLADAQQLKVVDFGAGKGYLTFALHDWLLQSRHLRPEVTGVELRAGLVEQGNAIIHRLGLSGLRFAQGDVTDWQPGAMDVMIALHACDTATDHAIHLGLRGGADIILCSPCCHKQVRPQLLQPHPLKPILQHGVHLGQEAEMLTDGLRALLLEAAGYDTQVFEFISLEHTNKNKMILAVKRAQPR